jgi:hypothetical protein
LTAIGTVQFMISLQRFRKTIREMACAAGSTEWPYCDT